MNDDGPQFSLCTLLAVGGWIATLMLLSLAWMVWSLDFEAHTALLIAETACVASAVAAVLQIRCYARQAMRLVRLTSGLERPDADVTEFPRR